MKGPMVKLKITSMSMMTSMKMKLMNSIPGTTASNVKGNVLKLSVKQLQKSLLKLILKPFPKLSGT